METKMASDTEARMREILRQCSNEMGSSLVSLDSLFGSRQLQIIRAAMLRARNEAIGVHHSAGADRHLAKKKQTLKERAEANVLAIRGSYDAPGFDACVAAELRRLKAKQKK